MASARWSSGSDSGCPWKLPPERISPVGGEHERVVGDGGQLALQGGAGVVQAVGDRAEHLRRAAQRVGILHPAAVGVRGDDRRAVEQAPQPPGHVRLPRLAAQVVQPRVERHGGALERLERQRDGDDRGVEDAPGLAQGQPAGGGHQVRAVDQGEPLLGGEHDGLEARARQRRRAGHPLAGELGLALADQHEREVRERREVARGADRPAARDHRDDAALQQPEQQLDQLHADARVPPPQRRREQQHHAAHDLGLERRARPDGVRAQQVDLQLGRVGGVDPHGRELAEAGGDAVDHAARRHRLLDHRAPGGDPLAVGGLQRRGRAAAGDGLQLGEGRHQTSIVACSMRRATTPAQPAPGQRARMRAALAAWS